jgi:hypothetical protein
MNDNCKGCEILNECKVLPKYAKDYSCPCFNCILKMMCSISCNSFNDFEDYAHERIEKEEAAELKHIIIKEFNNGT